MQREYQVLGGRLQIHLGDITRLDVDAIVNSENSDLLMDLPGGPSVSGAIRAVEGEPMARALARLGPLEPGRAVVLPAERLPCKWVIHAASVVQTEVGHRSSPTIIRQAVRSALQLAAGLGLGSVALPAFGVRAADVPAREASQAMVEAIVAALRESSSLERVVVALLDPESFLAFYEEAMRRATQATEPLVLRVHRQGDRLAWSLPHGASESAVHVTLRDDQLTDVAARLERLRDHESRRLLDPARELEALAERLDPLFPQAVRDRLEQASPRPLVFNLDPELAGLPFELARAGGAEPLFLRAPVSRSLRIDGDPVPASDARHDRLRALLLPGRAGDLRGGQTEARALADLLWRRARQRAPSTLLCAERASRDAVLTALGQADLVHWCGHTRAGPAWELGACDLAPEDVNALPRVPALVVANSCASQPRFAFAQRFLARGARHYVGTWWDVDDAQARRFGAAFYDELVLGRGVGEALQEARRILHAEHPLHGAAYLHFGDPRERLLQPQAL